MLPVHSQIDTRIGVHHFFTCGWAQHMFEQFHHHVTKLPDNAAVHHVGGEIIGFSDQHSTVDVEDKVALVHLVTNVQPI